MENNIFKSKLKNLNLFSKLVADFIEDEGNIISEFIPELCSKISQRKYNRSLLAEIIRETHSGMEFSEKQKANIDLLLLDNSLTVVSGQQAGFLGGSLYTLYKLLDTVRISRVLNDSNHSYNFVPIFWVEDNDDDLDEISKVLFLDEYSKTVEFKLILEEIVSVSDKHIGTDNQEIIGSVVEFLGKHRRSDSIGKIVSEAYSSANTISQGFIELLNKLTAHTGVLFISASKIMKSSIANSIVEEELSNPGRSKLSVEKKNKLLINNGYHIQASASEINVFMHQNGKRNKIEWIDGEYLLGNERCELNFLLNLLDSDDVYFSPKVLLRPVVQDYVLPNAIYVAGPGELAYHKQIDYLYEDFSVVKPLLSLRTSATIIDKRTARYLGKINKSPEYFMKRFTEIEKDFAEEMLGNQHDEVFSKFKLNLRTSLSELSEYVLHVDSQLTRNIQGFEVSIFNLLEQLDKKVHTSTKRNNEETLKKYRAISNSVYPNGILQERAINILQYMTQSEELIDLLLTGNNLSADNHHFIYI